MKKLYLSSLALSVALLFSACSSLPEGSQEPVVKIDTVTLSSGEAGFDIDYTIHHRSLEALPIKALDIEVTVNDKVLATYHDEDIEDLVAPNIDNHYSIFVKANHIENAQNDSLTKSPMLKVITKTTLKVTFTEDEKLSDFNPFVTHIGITSHAN